MRVRVREAARAASMRIEQRWVLPLRRRPERRLPADSWLPGHSPAQAARCLAVGNRAISTPISEMTAIAARSPMPGMLISRSIWVANVPASPPVGSGPTRPIVCMTWVSIWSRWSMRARCKATRWPWWAVNRPARASRRSLVLVRRTPRASPASTTGSRSPATSASSIDRPDTPKVSEATLSSLIPAASRTLSSRCFSRLRSSVSLVWYRVKSRIARTCSGGRKLPRKQPDLHQLGQPLGVLDVGFAARDRLDMRGVDHLDHQVWPADLAERRIHRPPVRPGGLHRHMRDTPLHHQPGRHLQQLTVERAERAGGLPPRTPLSVVA